MTKPKTKAAPVQMAAPPKSAAPSRARARKAAPSAPPEPPAPTTKIELFVSLLSRKEGATLAQLMAATGWRKHSVHGALAGAMKKRFGAKVLSEMVDGARVYRRP